jgi:hypothetical protein
MENLNLPFKVSPSVWGHVEKAHSKLLGHDRSNGGQLDLHRLCLVGKPELQSETCPTRKGWNSFDPAFLKGRVHESPYSLASSMLIFHSLVHHNTSLPSLGHLLYNLLRGLRLSSVPMGFE